VLGLSICFKYISIELRKLRKNYECLDDSDKSLSISYKKLIDKIDDIHTTIGSDKYNIWIKEGASVRLTDATAQVVYQGNSLEALLQRNDMINCRMNVFLDKNIKIPMHIKDENEYTLESFDDEDSNNIKWVYRSNFEKKIMETKEFEKTGGK